MTTYVLQNQVTIASSSGPTTLKAGKEIDDGAFDVTAIQAAGGVLFPEPNATAQAQAVALRDDQKNGRGAPVPEAYSQPFLSAADKAKLDAVTTLTSTRTTYGDAGSRVDTWKGISTTAAVTADQNVGRISVRDAALNKLTVSVLAETLLGYCTFDLCQTFHAAAGLAAASLDATTVSNYFHGGNAPADKTTIAAKLTVDVTPTFELDVLVQVTPWGAPLTKYTILGQNIERAS